MAAPALQPPQAPPPRRSSGGGSGPRGSLGQRGRDQREDAARSRRQAEQTGAAQAVLRRVQLEARMVQEQCGHAELRVKSLEEQMEDARVAILGLRIDLERENGRLFQLEAREKMLRTDIQALASRESLAEAVNARAAVEAGSKSLVMEVAKLLEEACGLESALVREEAQASELKEEECELEARRRELTGELTAATERLGMRAGCALEPASASQAGLCCATSLRGADIGVSAKVVPSAPAPKDAEPRAPVQRAPSPRAAGQEDPAQVPLLPGYAALSRLAVPPVPAVHPLVGDRGRRRQLARGLAA